MYFFENSQLRLLHFMKFKNFLMLNKLIIKSYHRKHLKVFDGLITFIFFSDEPCFHDDPRSPNYQSCIGYVNVPDNVPCSGSYASSRRLCGCELSDGCQGDIYKQTYRQANIKRSKP